MRNAVREPARVESTPTPASEAARDYLTHWAFVVGVIDISMVSAQNKGEDELLTKPLCLLSDHISSATHSKTIHLYVRTEKTLKLLS